MYILGIETSTMTGSVAILKEDRVLAEYTLHTPQTHTERLLHTIHQTLQAVSLSVRDLDGIAVSAGPGSFTGLRIGVTTAKSIAYSIRKPVAAIPSLDALASQYLFCNTLICPMIDARKKEVYAAFYRNSGAQVQRLSEYAVVQPEDFVREITEPALFLGDGVFPYRPVIERLLGEQAIFADPVHLLPRGSCIAKLGYDRFKRGEQDDCFALTPVYLRKSEAEIHWEQRHGNS